MQVSGAPDQKTLEKMMTVLMEIGEDIKKDWAGRVGEWEEDGQAKKDFIIISWFAPPVQSSTLPAQSFLMSSTISSTNFPIFSKVS